VTPEAVRSLLRQVASGSVDVEEALSALRWEPVQELAAGAAAPHARLDHHRMLRHGYPEVVLCEGKTVEQVRAICRAIAERGGGLLATRADEATRAALARDHPAAHVNELGRTVRVAAGEQQPDEDAPLLVLTAGTGDIPVAEEAVETLTALGQPVQRLYDVGVAGIHRLLRESRLLQEAPVVIVVAGMEGALPSVVGGLVAAPVIAVPTSVGYGASFSGLAALLGMLNSCASGVTVVNIDNGFGAAFAAHRIRQTAGQRGSG